MSDRVRMRHGAVTLTLSILGVAAVGFLVQMKNREVSQMARAALLSDPMYAESPVAALMEESIIEQDRRVLFATVGLFLLLAVWLGLATLITTRELGAELRRLRQAIREVSGIKAIPEKRLADERSIEELLTGLHSEMRQLRDSMQWMPTASMVIRVDQAGQSKFLQSGFVWKWALVAFAVFAATQVPSVLFWKLETWTALGVGGAGWLVGGLVIAMVSPGRTILEPAVGALFAAVSTLVYLILADSQFEGGHVNEYLLGTVAGFALALAGAYLGEAVQTRFEKSKKKPIRPRPAG